MMIQEYQLTTMIGIKRPLPAPFPPPQDLAALSRLRSAHAKWQSFMSYVVWMNPNPNTREAIMLTSWQAPMGLRASVFRIRKMIYILFFSY
uniref:Uncharacterized protein n=1 Tax=Leersia perrieri TaxID=77586 RepID=A0A0D9XYK9_9ORYZ